MKLIKILTICSYGVVILGGLILGVIYSTITEGVSYHLAAFGMSWQELSSSAQWMILNFERSAAAGFITASIAMIFLLVVAIRDNSLWSYVGVFIVGISEWLNILLRVASVSEHTPAKPPLLLNAVAVALIGLGFILSLLIYRQKHREN